APERKYTPLDAPRQELFALRDFLGFDRSVIVQATCHGTDNRALVDALQHADGRARGVCAVQPDVSESALRVLDEAGVRAVRFTFLRGWVDAAPPEAHLPVVRKAAALGWHVVVYFEAPDLERLTPFLAALPTIVVIDHMGRPDVTLGREHPQWRRFVAL